MKSSVLPWVKKTVFSMPVSERDQDIADRERLEHELAVKDEEIAELKCRVEELEASVEFHSEQRRQAIVRAGIERVRS